MSLEKIVIANIRRIRKERGLTQEELAELCGTSVSYIGLLETGKNIPKLSTIEKIANALNVDCIELFTPIQNEETDESKRDNSKLKQKILEIIEKDLDKYLF